MALLQRKSLLFAFVVVVVVVVALGVVVVVVVVVLGVVVGAVKTDLYFKVKRNLFKFSDRNWKSLVHTDLVNLSR